MKLSTLLKKQASYVLATCPEYEAVQIMKAAGFDEQTARQEVAQHLMEKEAASTIAAQGIDFDEAMRLVKSANIKVSELKEFKGEPSFEEMLGVELMKMASEAEKLEGLAEQVTSMQEKIAELQDRLDSTPETVEVPQEITKLAQSGDFTNADLEALMKLPSETLTKVANSGSQEPWKMGKAAGMAKDSVDPLLEFMLS
jgi:hypothetical protein